MHELKENEIVFRYVQIILHNQGTMVLSYDFLDDGSSLTMMEESMMN